MPMYQPGLVHTPVTPFTRERGIDFDRYAKLIDFHLAAGADALALPMHAGESVSLADGERRALVEFAIKQVNGRKPVIAHVSETGTAIAVALVEIDEFCEQVEVDPVVAAERHHRRVHEAELKGSHCGS